MPQTYTEQNAGWASEQIISHTLSLATTNVYSTLVSFLLEPARALRSILGSSEVPCPCRQGHAAYR